MRAPLEAPGGMQATRARAEWQPLAPGTLERRIRQAYRALVQRWGASRHDLRVVRLPGIVWLSPELALVGAGDVVVLARERPDRRLQVYHANLDQSVTFSAGRLEPDPLAAWTHPLRALVYGWLAQGVEVTGVDAVIAGACPAYEPVALPAVAACALACWRRPWRGEADPLESLRRAPWPEGWRGPVTAWVRAAEAAGEGAPAWVLVALRGGEASGGGGQALRAVDRSGTVRVRLGSGAPPDLAGWGAVAPSPEELARAVEGVDVEASAGLVQEAVWSAAPSGLAAALVEDPSEMGGLVFRPCGWVGLAGGPDGLPRGTQPGEPHADRPPALVAADRGRPIEPAAAAVRLCLVRRR